MDGGEGGGLRKEVRSAWCSAILSEEGQKDFELLLREQRFC